MLIFVFNRVLLQCLVRGPVHTQFDGEFRTVSTSFDSLSHLTREPGTVTQFRPRFKRFSFHHDEARLSVRLP